MVNVAIVGAGAAGLQAALTLQNAGMTFQILEADSKLGGRLQKREGFADFPIDVGGEWIHVNPSILNDLAGQTVTNTINTVAYLTEYDEYEEGSWNTLPYQNQDYKFVGYTWADFFNDHVANSGVKDSIVYNCNVNAIDYSSSPVTLGCTSGSTYTADHVIVTVSTKVLQDNDISFTPTIPSNVRSAIDKYILMDGLKAFLKFTSTFYRQGFSRAVDSQGVTYGDRYFYDITFGQSSSEHVMGSLAVGQPASSYVSQSEQQVLKSILVQLDELYNNQATPAYIDGFVQNWNNQPYVRGAYTHLGDRDYESAITTMRTSLGDGKVYFAGEAIPADNYEWGFAHEAAKSGRSAANKIISANGGTTEAPSPSPDPSCFSKQATVKVRDREGPTPMTRLARGDWVLVDATTNKYEPIYAFAHWNEDKQSEFLQLTTSSGSKLELTGDHMVFVVGRHHPVPARSVQVGDLLVSGGSNDTYDTDLDLSGGLVTMIQTVRRTGIYAPLTPSGALVVDGILASSYVALQQESLEFVQWHDGTTIPLLSQQRLAHWGLAPFRMICTTQLLTTTAAASTLCDASADNHGMPAYVRMGLQLSQWADQQSKWTQVLLIFPLFLILLGILASAEVPWYLGVPGLVTLVTLLYVHLVAKHCNVSFSVQRSKSALCFHRILKAKK
ncbi:Protein hedgehog [Seminavis robusta]|uniref:Protein hedgehog n=1 Tax=Seminavis robusta TaxID=568900 RepID=A0A9N8E9M9_9STRA|nr:Protein hedgehog [Seminavis robusta]|eukprot:Sro849_g210510.1 Protein hedgehog (670) ;mRNA; f:10223-12332